MGRREGVGHSEERLREGGKKIVLGEDREKREKKRKAKEKTKLES